MTEEDSDKKGKLYFDPNKVRQWIEGVTQNAVKKFSFPETELKKKFGITKVNIYIQYGVEIGN